MSVNVDSIVLINVLRISPLKINAIQPSLISLYQHSGECIFHKNGLESTKLDKIDTNSHHKID